MAATPVLPDGWWRTRELFLKQLEQHGSYKTLANVHGGDQSLYSKWGRRHGVKLTAGPKKSTLHAVDAGEQVSEVEILKQRLREHESHAKKIREGEVTEERIIQRLEVAIGKHGGPHQVRVQPPRRTKQRDDETELALLFSDTHASETVSLEETMGLNAYDWPTMLRRMDRLADAVISHKEHFNGSIRKLHLWMLGDMLSGDIHEELAITNDRPTAEAVVDFAYDTVRWIEERFYGEFEEIVVSGVPGNHPRAKPKPAAKQAHNNADWLSYKMMEALLRKHDRITFDLRRGGFNLVTVADRWRVLLMHGDGIRSTMPGVPWGGVVRRITTLEAQFSKAKTPLDYVALGHFHSGNSLDGVHARTFMNGSVKGADEYSLKQFGSGRDASQALLVFHKRRGWTGTLPIDLQDVIPAGEGWEAA